MNVLLQFDMDKQKFLKYHENVIIKLIQKAYSGYLKKNQRKVYEYKIFPNRIKTNMIIYRKGTFNNKEEFICESIDYNEEMKEINKTSSHKNFISFTMNTSYKPVNRFNRDYFSEVEFV